MSHVLQDSRTFPTLKLGRLWVVWSRTKKWNAGKSVFETLDFYYYLNLGRVAIAWWSTR